MSGGRPNMARGVLTGGLFLAAPDRAHPGQRRRRVHAIASSRQDEHYSVRRGTLRCRLGDTSLIACQLHRGRKYPRLTRAGFVSTLLVMEI